MWSSAGGPVLDQGMGAMLRLLGLRPLAVIVRSASVTRKDCDAVRYANPNRRTRWVGANSCRVWNKREGTCVSWPGRPPKNASDPFSGRSVSGRLACQGGKHLGHCLPGYRISHSRIQLGQRRQREPPLPVSGMRDFQLFRLHYNVSVKQNIDVDRPRTVLERSHSPHAHLDLLHHPVQQLYCREKLGLKLSHQGSGTSAAPAVPDRLRFI